MACPGTGAHPTPEAVGSNILLDLGVAALSSRLGVTKAKGLISAAELILGSMSVTDLCAINPSDPGPPTVEMLKWDLIEGFLPGLGATQGTLGRWLWDSAVYHFFQISCACNDASTQPPITVVTAPPGSQDYPTDTAHQPQLTRIENNQASSSEGLNTIYNTAQIGTIYTGDLWWRHASSHPSSLAYPTLSISGEGTMDLVPDTVAPEPVLWNTYAVRTHLTTIPSTVAARGTLTPRLYGVGSVYWESGEDINGQTLILQRDSIHYQTQLILAPRLTVAKRLRWRLMPGVVADLNQAFVNPDGPFQPTVGYYGRAPQPYHAVGYPSGFTDPPFQPPPASTTFFSLPGPKP